MTADSYREVFLYSLGLPYVIDGDRMISLMTRLASLISIGFWGCKLNGVHGFAPNITSYGDIPNPIAPCWSSLDASNEPLPSMSLRLPRACPRATNSSTDACSLAAPKVGTTRCVGHGVNNSR